ncbi:hypothetical protein Emag_004653 [Eimeria magna]
MLPSSLSGALWALSAALLSSSWFALTAVGVGQPQDSKSAESALFPPSYKDAFVEEGLTATGSSQESSNSSSLALSVDGAASPLDSPGKSKSLGEVPPSSPTENKSLAAQAPSEAYLDAGRLQEQHSLSLSGRTQEIGKHEPHEAGGAVFRGPVSSMAEAQGSTVSRPDSDFFTWNPLKGDEPNEADALKHEGTPEDFVAIRLLDELEGSADVVPTTSVSASSTARVQSGSGVSGYQSRWQRDSPISSVRTPVEESRWTRTVDQNGRRSSIPGDSSRLGGSGGQGYLRPTPNTQTTPTSRPRSGYQSRWQREAPDYSQTPAVGRSRWEWTDTSTPSTGRSRSTDNASHNRYTLLPRNRYGDSSTNIPSTRGDGLSGRSGYQSGSRSPWYPGSNSRSGEYVEDEDITEKKPECSVTVAGVEISTTYVDFACSGEINVPYKSTPGDFAPRNLKVQNNNKQPVTVVFKTVNATFSSQPTTSSWRLPSFLSTDGPASFLQDASDQEQEEASLNYVKDMLKEMRKHLRKYPDTPLDVVVSFKSPLDNPETAAHSQSFMQSKEGGDHILQTYLSDGGAVGKLLRKLLDLEGRSILFWELSKEASLQMVPVDKDLPPPPKPLTESPVFIQAKAELEQQCSAEATARSHLISVVDSGVGSHVDLDTNVWRNLSEVFDGQDNDGNSLLKGCVAGHLLSPGSVSSQSLTTTRLAGFALVFCLVYSKEMVSSMTLMGGTLMRTLDILTIRTVMELTLQGSIGNGVRGIAYALMNGAHVINNSWGGPDATRSLQLIIERAAQMRNGLGVLIVNAAGNDSSNNDYVPVYPAQFDYSHTIAVGSYSSDGSRSKFSNYGSRTVTLFAPGVAALIFGVFMKSNSQVSAAEVKDIIKATLQRLPSAVGISQWGGAPDAMSAVLCTDMLFDLAPGETHVPTLLVRGADLQAEVYTTSGRLLGRAHIPFKLKSSYVPETNHPSDSLAATAFAGYKKNSDESGTGTLKITAIVLGCIAGVLLIAISSFLLYIYLKRRRTQQGSKEEATANTGGQQQVERETALPEESSTAQEEGDVLADAS